MNKRTVFTAVTFAALASAPQLLPGQTTDIRVGAPAAFASACPLHVSDAGRLEQQCVTRVGAMNFPGSDLQPVDTGLVSGEEFPGHNNQAQAAASPLRDGAWASAVSNIDGPGAADGRVYRYLSLISRTMNEVVPGYVTETIAGTATSKGFYSGAGWTVWVGRDNCNGDLLTAGVDLQSGEVFALGYFGCEAAQPQPTYAFVAGGSSADPTSSDSVGAAIIETFNCDANDVFSCPIDTEKGFTTATFVGNVRFFLPLGTALAIIDAAAGETGAASVDPEFSSDDPDVEVVVSGLPGTNPSGSPLAGFEKILADLKTQNVDLSGFAALGWLPSNNPLPTTSTLVTPAPNSYGWNNTNVAVALNAADPGGPGVQAINFSLSGAQAATGVIPGASGTIRITAEGVTTLTYFAQDTAGNKESPKTLMIQIDKTPPTIGAALTPSPNANGWNNTNVTVQFTATDSLSGLAGVSSPVALSSEGKGQIVSGSATDRAGNTANLSVTVNIDKTSPVMSGLPASGCTLWPPNHQLVQVANVSAADALSGVAPGSFLVTGASDETADAGGSGNTAPDIVISGGNVEVRAERSGSGNGRVYTVDATATDLAGNVAIASGSCVVPHDQGKGN